MRRFVLILLLVLGVGSAFGVLGPYLWFRHHFLASQRALLRRDFERTLQHLDQCFKLRPNDADLHLLAAQAARRQGLLERAQEHLTACDEGQPATEERSMEGILLRVQQGEFDNNERYLRALVMGDDASKILILEAMAQGYMHNLCLKEALICLELLLRDQPDHSQAHLWRGQIWEKLEGLDEALSDFTRAVDLAPNSFAARLHLATMLARTGHVGDAAAQFEYLRREQPANEDVLLGLAGCRQHLAQLTPATELVDAVLAQHPASGPALLARGRLAFRQVQLAQAESVLRQATLQSPYDPEVYLFLSYCQQSQGKTEEARQSLDRHQKLADEMTHLRALMLRAIGEGPPEAAIPYQIGMILIRNGREEEGVRWLRSALRLDPRFQPARQALADYTPSNGQVERGAQYHP
jgi:tetratricopeptide (TPR) repeat protein